jgi:hypothetical protein
MGMALQGKLGLLWSRGFKPRIVYIDPYSMFWSIVRDLSEVEVDVGGAASYVPKVEPKTSRIKELYRTVKSGLVWVLPGLLVQDLVAFVVSRITIHHTSWRTQ